MAHRTRISALVAAIAAAAALLPTVTAGADTASGADAVTLDDVRRAGVCENWQSIGWTQGTAGTGPFLGGLITITAVYDVDPALGFPASFDFTTTVPITAMRVQSIDPSSIKVYTWPDPGTTSGSGITVAAPDFDGVYRVKWIEICVANPATTTTTSTTSTTSTTTTTTAPTTTTALSTNCSPGYWKTHPEAWGSVPTGATYGSIFSSAPAPYSGYTLLEALNLRGGDGNALARQSVAAYLDSIHRSQFAYSTSQVVAIANDGWSGATTIESAKDALEDEISACEASQA